jgi:hypothetical protein
MVVPLDVAFDAEHGYGLPAAQTDAAQYRPAAVPLS